jgi:hypothetical protein
MIRTPRLLPLGPTARFLRVPVAWLREEALANRVPHLRAGRQLLFDLDKVERILTIRARSQEVPDAE